MARVTYPFGRRTGGGQLPTGRRKPVESPEDRQERLIREQQAFKERMSRMEQAGGMGRTLAGQGRKVPERVLRATLGTTESPVERAIRDRAARKQERESDLARQRQINQWLQQRNVEYLKTKPPGWKPSMSLQLTPGGERYTFTGDETKLAETGAAGSAAALDRYSRFRQEAAQRQQALPQVAGQQYLDEAMQRVAPPQPQPQPAQQAPAAQLPTVAPLQPGATPGFEQQDLQRYLNQVQQMNQAAAGQLAQPYQPGQPAPDMSLGRAMSPIRQQAEALDRQRAEAQQEAALQATYQQRIGQIYGQPQAPAPQPYPTGPLPAATPEQIQSIQADLRQRQYLPGDPMTSPEMMGAMGDYAAAATIPGAVPVDELARIRQAAVSPRPYTTVEVGPGATADVAAASPEAQRWYQDRARAAQYTLAPPAPAPLPAPPAGYGAPLGGLPGDPTRQAMNEAQLAILRNQAARGTTELGGLKAQLGAAQSATTIAALQALEAIPSAAAALMAPGGVGTAVTAVQTALATAAADPEATRMVAARLKATEWYPYLENAQAIAAMFRVQLSESDVAQLRLLKQMIDQAAGTPATIAQG